MTNAELDRAVVTSKEINTDGDIVYRVKATCKGSNGLDMYYDRELTKDELEQLLENPWQMFTRPDGLK